MFVDANLPLVVAQKDSRDISIQLIQSIGPPIVYFDATLYTVCKVYVKSDQTAADPVAITGTVTGNTTSGFVASFNLSGSVTAVAGEFWIHVTIEKVGGSPLTILAKQLVISAA